MRTRGKGGGSSAGWGQPLPPSTSSDPSLTTWDAASRRSPKDKKQRPTDDQRRARRRRTRRIIWWTIGSLAAVLIVAVLGAPMIASRLAPGIIESAAAGSIKGSLKVSRVSLSWGGPAVIGPVELREPSGAKVGQVEVEAPIGVWRIINEAWWSRKSFDLPTIELRGDIALKRAPDGTTNLQRAIEPARPSTPAPGGAAGGGIQHIGAKIKVARLKITVSDDLADPSSPLREGVSIPNAAGDVAITYDAPKGTITAKVDLAGDAEGSTLARASEPTRLFADVSAKLTSAGTLETAAATIRLAAAPVPLVDGLANLGGSLADSIGPALDLTIDASGNFTAAAATVDAKAQGLTAHIRADLADGVLTAADSTTIHVDSLAFLGGVPQLRDALERAGESVHLSGSPSLDLAVDAPVRIPASLLGLPGAAPAGPGAPPAADLRGAATSLTITLGAMSGRVLMGDGADGADDAIAGDDTPWRTFALEPVVISVSTDDLADGLAASVSTTALVDGASAGRLRVDATAGSPLDGRGEFDLLALRSGSVIAAADGFSAALLQPLADSLGAGVDLAADLGPTIDARATLTATDRLGASIDSGGGVWPVASAEATFSARHARAAARADITEAGLTAPGEAVTVHLDRAGPLLSRLIGEDGGVAVTGGGATDLVVSGVSIPLISGKPDGDRAAGSARLTIRDLAATVGAGADTVAPADSGPIGVSAAALIAELKPGEPARIGVDVQAAHAGEPFTIAGEFALDGLRDVLSALAADDAGADPLGRFLALRPSGRLEAIDVPMSLASLAPGAAAVLSPGTTEDTDAVKLARLVNALTGDKLAASLEIAQADAAAAASGRRISIRVSGAESSVIADAVITPDELSLLSSTVTARITPDAASPLLVGASGQPGSSPGPSTQPMSLDRPVVLRAEVRPLRVPLARAADGSIRPDWSRTADATVTLTTDSDVVIRGVPIGESPTTFAIRQFSAEATARPGDYFASPAPAAAAPIAVRLAAGVAERAGADPFAELSAGVTYATGSGALDATLRVPRLLAEPLERMLGKPGVISGAIGESAAMVVTVKRASADAQTDIVLEDLTARRLTVRGLRPRIDDDRLIYIDTPAEITWRPTAAYLNQYIVSQPAPAAAGAGAPRPAGAPQGAVPPAQRSVIREDPTIDVVISRLSLARAQTNDAGEATSGIFRPGVFDLAMALTVPRLVVDTGENKTVAMDNLRASIASADQRPGTITFDATVGSIAGGGGPAGAPAPADQPNASSIRGAIERLADARGVPTPDAATINLDANVEQFPSALVDALAGQNGLLAELLGPTVTLRATAREMGQSGGSLEAAATAERASARLSGRVVEQRFVTDAPATVTLDIIRPELIQKISDGVPLIQTLEKRKDDGAGLVTAEGLTIPMGGDLSTLNGEIRVELGQVRFTTRSFFSRVLKQIDARPEGVAGRRLEPFLVSIKSGVATYQRYRLPMGEFTAETAGTVDLVKRRIDIIVYVPLFALADEVAGAFNTGLGSLLTRTPVLDRATMMPLRIKGPLDSPSVTPDLELFIRERGDQFIKDPGKLLENILKEGLPIPTPGGG